jgi:hypothetical protein
MRTAPLARSVMLLALAGACRSHPSSDREPGGERSPEETCREDACVRLHGRPLGDRPPVVLGADVDVTSFEACIVRVGWRVGANTHFQATLRAADDVFPLAEGLARFSYCRGILTVGDHSMPPAAGLLLNPDSSLPRLEPGDVFIPLGGEATLDGDLYASTHVEQSAPTNGAPLSLSIGVQPSRRSGSAFHGLRAGDSFPWGDSQATVVRIVISADVIAGTLQDGWVEVALSPQKAGRP